MKNLELSRTRYPGVRRPVEEAGADGGDKLAKLGCFWQS